jgi:hypothetical protein
MQSRYFPFVTAGGIFESGDVEIKEILKAAQLFECDPIYMADNEDLSVDDFQMINSLCRLLENYI